MRCDMEEREREDKKRERENQVNEGMTLFDGALGRQIDIIYIYIYTQASSACVCENKIFKFSRVQVF